MILTYGKRLLGFILGELKWKASRSRADGVSDYKKNVNYFAASLGGISALLVEAYGEDQFAATSCGGN